MNKRVLVYLLLTGFFGVLLGATVTYFVNFTGTTSEEQASEPLYWVSPMDPTYRRDEPGTSPMGMELVAVYAGNPGEALGLGVVSISPIVENNLGVRTALVEVEPFRSTIRTVGYVQFDEDKLIHMHPRVEGWIDELNVKTQGEFIEEGQAIYSMYSPTLVNAQEELLLAMERSNQRFVVSAEERLLALQVPQSLIDEVKANRRVSRNVTVYAPQSGVVANLNVREGQFVQPGNQIISIGVLDEVWVIAEVFERQASLVSVGDFVNMTLGYLPGREWQGVVDFIYPTLDEQTRTVSVRLKFRNPGQELKPNMFAQVTILHSEEGEQALLIPHEAVIRTGTQDRAVLAMGEGKFKSVEVTLGRLGDTSVEILEGLEAGDRVVTSAHFLLDSESSITSDFLRMSPDQEMDHDQMVADPTEMSDMDEPSELVWSRGRVEHVMTPERMISITHDPVPEWEWPAMTMSFDLDQNIDESVIAEGREYEFQLNRITGSKVVIVDFRELELAQQPGN
ncbi:MAG: efflux RND transporter periplasmic adaptor subunit [Gammaproteobacteria bacterium]|nr:efflux RND transporter periplasmic adaptor subunit [Gammaproteobacteria bacterium]